MPVAPGYFISKTMCNELKLFYCQWPNLLKGYFIFKLNSEYRPRRSMLSGLFLPSKAIRAR
jgi:hypothetical protein